MSYETVTLLYTLALPAALLFGVGLGIWGRP